MLNLLHAGFGHSRFMIKNKKGKNILHSYCNLCWHFLFLRHFCVEFEFLTFSLNDHHVATYPIYQFSELSSQSNLQPHKPAEMLLVVTELFPKMDQHIRMSFKERELYVPSPAVKVPHILFLISLL